MGIKGLTTYVEKHSDQLFEIFQLKDCSVVIDGNSLSAQLYHSVCKSNSAFGGDYDSYADCVRHFFNTLAKCNVTPLILLDGGKEVKKLKTIRSRFQTRICDARKVNPLVQKKRSVFPLFLSITFKEIVFEMEIKFVQCAFEADHEIAAVARIMNCPVLSYDSDFYIYDVIYIPFDKFSLDVTETGELPSGEKCYAIDCKMYRVENFLSSFGSLDKTVLPLMATVLGNDYIEKKVFQNFFSKIKHPKSRTSSDTQRHIVGLLTWLRGKTLYGATAMILSCIKQCDRQKVLEQLNKSIHGYSRTSTVLPLLCPDVSGDKSSANRTCFEFGDADTELADAGTELADALKKCPANTYNKPSAEEMVFQQLPLWFRESFHKGLLPPSFMDMITLRMYFCMPQVEDYSLTHSHGLSLTILPVIFGLLTVQDKNTSRLTVVYRSKNSEMKKLVLDPVGSMQCLSPFPRLEDLPNVSKVVRASVIFESLGLEDKHKVLLDAVPEAWKIYVIALVFWAQRTTHLRSSLPSFISAILLTAVAVKVVDGVVGYFRTRKNFLCHHGSKVKKLKRNEKSKQMLLDDQCGKHSSDGSVNGVDTQDNARDIDIEQLSCDKNLTVSDALKNVSEPDCLLFAETFVLFRYFDESLQGNPKLYNVTVVHALAQFQSCLLHVMYLNAVLNFPFEQTKISSFFSGTSVYNLYAHFHKRANVSSYIAQLFGQSASVLSLFFSLQNVVSSFLPSAFTQSAIKKSMKKKSKKRKNVKENLRLAADELSGENLVFEENAFVDENNKFSALSLI